MKNEGLGFDRFNYYQSANAQADAIKENFLVRKYEYSVILEDLLRHPGKGSVQHYLILGSRGSGKSTLLRRIQVEIDTNKKLLLNYIALNMAEEQANIYRLFDLLEEIVKELESQGYDITWPSSSNAETYSEELLSVIHEALDSVEKKLVLLLDNIDRVFENLGEDAAVLRAHLQNFGDIKIIGGSTRMTEHFWAYDQPFYEFFRVLQLEPLDREEVRSLLSNWGEKLNTPLLKEFIEKRPGQLETVRILTDGLPRTLQFFVNILLTQEPQTGYDYVQQIMDKVTPLYQERLSHLPPAQRKIVLQLAFCWESVGAGELAKAARMENRVVSAQLNQLIDKGVVDKIQTGTKNHLYRLSERFFNLWLIFTQGSPREKRRAKYLAIFLENFYDADELIERAKQHLELLKGKSIGSDKAALLTKAYSQVSCIPSRLRDDLIDRTRELSDIDFALKNELPPKITEIIGEVKKLVGREEWVKAEALIQSIEQNDGTKEYFMSAIASERKETSKVKELLLSALAKGLKIASCPIAKIYYYYEEYELSEKYAKIGFDSEVPGCTGILACSLYRNNKNKERALSLLKQALIENPNDKESLMMLPVLQAWNGAFKEMEEALEVLIKMHDYPPLRVSIDLLVHRQTTFVSELYKPSKLKGTTDNEVFIAKLIVDALLSEGLSKKTPQVFDAIVEKMRLYIYQRQEFYYGSQGATTYLNKKAPSERAAKR